MRSITQFTSRNAWHTRQRGAFAGIAPVLLWLGLAALPACAAGVVTSPDEASLDAALNGGGLVTFACDGTITLNHTKTIALNTTIDATGHDITLSANPTAKGGSSNLRVLMVNYGITAIIKNVTIANGYAYSGNALGANARGGGIFNRGTLTLSQCMLRDNTAQGLDGTSSEEAGHDAYGGAIYNNAGSLTLDRCTITDNRAQGGNSGLYWIDGVPTGSPGANGIGGALFIENGSLAVIACTFSNNIAAGGAGSDVNHGTGGGAGGQGWGGAIYGNGTLSGSTFVNNHSVGGTGGQAVYAEYYPDSGGAGFGGAVYGGGTFVNCTFTQNLASGGSGGGAGLTYTDQGIYSGTGGDGGDGHGGAVYGSGFSSTNCTFASNTAIGGAGGWGGYDDPFYGQTGEPGIAGNEYGGNLQIQSNAIAVNTILAAGGSPGNCAGTLTDNGHNLSSDGTCGLGTTSYENTDPQLSALAGNGGPTQTMALGAHSPVINHGSDAAAPTQDQRGAYRNGVSDIGAYEYNGVFPFTISGRITNNAGAGIAGVSVAIGNYGTVSTDSAGNYSLAEVPPGSYAVTPTKPGMAFDPATATVNQASPQANFTALFTLSGLVRTSTLAPVAGVAVTLRATNGLLPPGISPNPAITDSSGAFKFSNVPADLYNLTPAKPGCTFSPASTGVSVSTAPRAVNFVATPYFRILGRVIGCAGAALANVSVTRTGSSISAITNSAGYFTFTGVPNGSYTLMPSLSSYYFTPNARTVTVNGADVTGQNFVGAVFVPYRITGRIATSGGAGMPNVSVTRSGSTTPMLTNSAGYYTITGVPNGTYTITPSLSGHSFTPSTKTVVVNGANATGQNFIGY